MLRAKCKLDDYGQKMRVLISQDEGGKRVKNGMPIVFKKRENHLESQPTLEFDLGNREEIATFILDWIAIGETACVNLNAGFSKEKEALMNHLKDMRKLVFKDKFQEQDERPK